MKLRNKLTGDVIEVKGNWKDYEPEDVWYITSNGEIERGNADISWVMEKMIGNYFESKEDAEEAVKKLEAWKRLKDKGFKFEGWDNTDHSTVHNFSLFVAIEELENINKDLDLLFGSE